MQTTQITAEELEAIPIPVEVDNTAQRQAELAQRTKVLEKMKAAHDGTLADMVKFEKSAERQRAKAAKEAEELGKKVEAVEEQLKPLLAELRVARGQVRDLNFKTERKVAAYLKEAEANSPPHIAVARTRVNAAFNEARAITPSVGTDSDVAGRRTTDSDGLITVHQAKGEVWSDGPSIRRRVKYLLAAQKELQRCLPTLQLGCEGGSLRRDPGQHPQARDREAPGGLAACIIHFPGRREA